MMSAMKAANRLHCQFRLVVVVAFAIVAFVLSGVAASHRPISVDLHPYGFPSTERTDGRRVGLFYLSEKQLALLFETEPADTHKFGLLVFNAEGDKTAEISISGNPKALDITAGPSGGVAVGKEGHLDIYDHDLQLSRSIPLAPATTGIAFDRKSDQLIVQTVDRDSGQRTAHFLDAKELESSAALIYPIKARAIFGKDQLVYTVTGECKGAGHIVSEQPRWRPLDALPICDSLVFVEDDKLAYAFDGDLYVVNAAGEQVLKIRIPVGGSFEAPAFIGLSDDSKRLAISALAKKPLASGWPYYDQVLLYDLVSKRLIFKHALPQTARAAALSPDGHQLATIEEGVLMLTPVP